MARFIFRLTLVAAAIIYTLPYISGIQFHGHVLLAIGISFLFNLVYMAIEWLFAILEFGINIGTLGLGSIITKALKLAATLLAPSLALYGIAQAFPNIIKISHFYPSALVAGLVLGSVLWVSVSEGKKK